MMFYLYNSEVELLSELEAGFLEAPFYDQDVRRLSMPRSKFLDVVSDILEWMSLLDDKQERFLLSNLGCRIIRYLNE